MWKFQDGSLILILREIKIGEFRGLKSAILTNREAFNFEFYAFLQFFEAKSYQINQIWSLQNSKTGSFKTFNLCKIDFT